MISWVRVVLVLHLQVICAAACHTGQYPTDASNEYLQAPFGAYMMLAGATRSAITRGSPGWDAGSLFLPHRPPILVAPPRPAPPRL